MADVKISALTALTGANVDSSTDVIPIVDTSVPQTKKILVQELQAVNVNSQSANYTGLITDANKIILHPTSDDNPRTFTIPANASVAYPVGTSLVFVNLQNTVTVAITTDTLILLGTGGTGSRTVAENGELIATKILSTTWICRGTNVS